MSQNYLWHHNGLECCDIINMPYNGVIFVYVTTIK